MNGIATKDERFFDMTLKATVIYDDFDFATRATGLLERAARRAREAVKWNVKPWRLDALKQPSLAEVAEAEAADADLVVFALNQTPSPPMELMMWLERWAAHRQIEDAAVMALLPDEIAAATPFWHELEQFAGQFGLAFLSSHNVHENGDSMRFVQQLWLRKLPAGMAFGLSADPPHPARHWGINE